MHQSRQTYQGLGVWYAPAPGYHGVDQFDWDVIDANSLSHDTVVVEVKQPSASEVKQGLARRHGRPRWHDLSKIARYARRTVEPFGNAALTNPNCLLGSVFGARPEEVALDRGQSRCRRCRSTGMRPKNPRRSSFHTGALCGFGCAANLKMAQQVKDKRNTYFYLGSKSATGGNYPVSWIQIPPLSENTSWSGLPTDGIAFGFGESCALLRGR